MESAIFYLLYLKKTENATSVRFSDYNLDIPPWGHSFLILL